MLSKRKSSTLMKTALLGFMGCVLSAQVAVAATTIFTDRAAFDLATGGLSGFEDFSDGSLTTPSLSVSGDDVFVTGPGQVRARPTVNGADVTLMFNSPISAFGGDFDLTRGGNDIGLRFTLGTGEVVAQELSSPFDGFWGFIADSSFSTLVISGGSGPGFAETHDFDNLSFGISAPVAAVPVPAGLLMLLAALAGAFGFNRLQARRRA